ncbi:MAG TPA: ATP-binding protein [Acidimicrobiales bacterium]|nr:ATP-binding protein [Acidimicrobiales bacterium]
MIRRLLAAYLSITAFALVVLGVPLGLTFARGERDRLYADIERDATTVATLVEDPMEAGSAPNIGKVMADYRRRTNGRILVVDTTGRSVADSAGPTGRDYAGRPEVADALDGHRAVGTRPGDDGEPPVVYVALPVASGGAVHGAVRVTFPTTSIDERVRAAWLRLGALSGIVLAVVAGAGLLLARSVTRPVRAMETAAERVADGDLTARVDTGTGPPEVRRLAATFNRTAERLDELVGAQQRFVADAAHQLRSPLTALRLRLENVEAQVPPDEVPRIEAAVDEVQRLSRIVDGLLVLARSDAEHQPVVAVDLAALAAERVDAWTDVAEAQDVTLAPETPPHLWVKAPEGGVEQIVDNLLSNALAVAPEGSTVAVRVEATPAGGALHVVDEGPGMPEADRRRAFDRFWRGTTSSPGSGLGLPIVRHLARAAGGDARLEAGPGDRGVDAVVELPAQPAPGGRGRGGSPSRRQGPSSLARS